jgi:hypothetical protein
MKRLLPPSDGQHSTFSIPDTTVVPAQTRTYSCALGSAIDVPDADAALMIGNGWQPLTYGATVGPSLARPAVNRGLKYPSDVGRIFVDTDVVAVIVFDGQCWRNFLTGAAV